MDKQMSPSDLSGKLAQMRIRKRKFLAGPSQLHDRFGDRASLII